MSECALDEASALLRQIAGNRVAGESMKSVFRRVNGQLADWSYSRVRAVWYRDERVRIKSAEVEQLRAVATEPDRSKEKQDELAELRSTVARLAKYEALLQRIDAEMFGPEISATGDQVRQARRLLGKGGV